MAWNNIYYLRVISGSGIHVQLRFILWLGSFTRLRSRSWLGLPSSQTSSREGSALRSLKWLWQASGSHWLLAEDTSALPHELLYRDPRNMAAPPQEGDSKRWREKVVLWSECWYPPKIHVLTPNLQGDGITRWGLWKVIRWWVQSHHEWDKCP